MSETITKEQIDQLIEDVSYMQDEAEALKYVIDYVPYEKQPPNGRSIAELLTFIDFVQKSYYHSYLEKAVENRRPPIQIDSFKQFIETFDRTDQDTDNIQSLLNGLAKHRARLINAIKNISVIDWGIDVYVNNHKMTLFDFIQQIVRFDHTQLKKIAGLVRILGEQKQTDRQIKQKRDLHNPSFKKNN